MSPIDPARRLHALWGFRHRRLTLFGRSVVLIGCELLVNAACWTVAGILFGGCKDTQQVLGLALLAWVCVIPFISSCFQIIEYYERFLVSSLRQLD